MAIVLATGALAEPAPAHPQRVVSLNVCTDQLLITLADPGQIAALSRFSRDPTYSFHAKRAHNWPALRGVTEEVLRLKPDLVLASSFTRPELRQALGRFGIRIETFDPATTIESGRLDILRVARLLGQDGRGKRLLGEVDTALAAGRARVDGWRKTFDQVPSVLQLQRRAFVSGRDSLLGDLLAFLKIPNAAAALGVRSVGRVSLETIIKVLPDILIVESADDRFNDQGKAILGHPALEAIVPAGRRVALPPQLIICSGPSLPAAIRRISSGLEAIRGLPGTR